MSTKRTYTRELIESVVKESITYADVCRRLGARASGGSYELIRNRIKEYDIDVSHFLGQSVYAGKRNPNYQKRIQADDILTRNKEYRVNHKTLKRALLEKGFEYKCGVCTLSKWLDEYITLDIDHIDGDWTNCEIENLRFLCPNCHRQTNTFAGRNNKKIKVDNKSKRIYEPKFIISDEELSKLIWEFSLNNIAKMYKVSANTVRRRYHKLNVDKPPKGYWQRFKRK